MPREPLSFSRITLRVLFLAAALCLGLFFRSLPNFFNLDFLRPRLADLLGKSFHCRVLVGNVETEIIPSPGLVIRHVVFLEPASPKVLASANSVHVSMSIHALFEGRLRFWAVRFMRPRFIVHREKDPSGKILWTTLTLPQADSHDSGAGVDHWEIRNGTLEIWDHTTVPTSKLIIQELNGSFDTRTLKGAMAGKPLFLGPAAILTVHYESQAVFPIEARFGDIALKTLPPLLHSRLSGLDGIADFIVKVRLVPAIEIRTLFTSIRFSSLPGAQIRGAASFQTIDSSCICKPSSGHR